MLKRLVIEDMFGVHGNTYDLTFNQDLTILVGKNGTGKTTLLNFLSAILQRRFDRLLATRFGRATVVFEGFTLIVDKLGPKVVVFYEDYQDRARKAIDPDNQRAHNKLKHALLKIERDQFVPIPPPLNRYYHVSSGEPPLDEDSPPDGGFEVDVSCIYFPTYRRLEIDLGSIVEDFQRYPRPYRPRAIERLLDSSGGTVFSYSNRDIDEIVRRKWLHASQRINDRLNSLIRQFTVDLLEVGQTEERIGSWDLEELEATLLEGLTKAEVIEKEQIPLISSFIEAVRRGQEVLQSGQDLEKSWHSVMAAMLCGKIAHFGDLYKEARQDISAIEEPFTKLTVALSLFLDKVPSISEAEGTLQFNISESALSFMNLSAGEKQLVALMVYITLATQPGSVVLIDEPELSLHVTWQRELLGALLELAPQRQLIVSTHSPQIVSRFRDSTIALGEED